MRHTPEFRKAVSEGLDVSSVRKRHAEEVQRIKERQKESDIPEFTRGRQERLVRLEAQLADAEAQIEALEVRVAHLVSQAETADDGTFNEEFEALYRAITTITAEVMRYEQDLSRLYTAEFVMPSDIHDLPEFLDRVPMFWVPRKDDIRKIL